MAGKGGPLAGRVALVTGGSRGIGAASSLALAELGADVLLTYRSDAQAAEDVARVCVEHGVRGLPVRADLDSVEGAVNLVSATAALVSHVDIVISNAAGSFPRGPLAEMDVTRLSHKVAVDVAVLHTLTTAFAPGMADRGFGRLLVISSWHAQAPCAPGMTAHGVSKAALETYVRYAADELGVDGVTINALQLGFVTTDATASVPPPARDLLLAATPAGRLANAQDIAGAVALLAQPASGWINGAVIPTTGGLNFPISQSRVLGLRVPVKASV
ncbi:MAG TPA: SDR family oxidoreductase [Pseudonocardiaceae bacterium]|nr:SDR family oxidoreductase [Pseudonocardiaceae bacterium]